MFLNEEKKFFNFVVAFQFYFQSQVAILEVYMKIN